MAKVTTSPAGALALIADNIQPSPPAAATIAASPTGAVEVVNTVTITTTAAHGLVVGESVTVAGVTVAGYNGTWVIQTVPSPTTFTYTDPVAGLAASGGGTATGIMLPGSLAGLKCDLYQTDVVLNPWPGDAALTAAVATYHGYAQATVTWGTPSQADDGSYECIGEVPVFQPTDAVTPNNIYGAYFTKAGGGAIMRAFRLDNAPAPMDTALRTITLILRYRPETGSIGITVS